MRHARSTIFASAAAVAWLSHAGALPRAAVPLFVLILASLLWLIDRSLPARAAAALPSSLPANYLSFLLEATLIDAAFAWAASTLALGGGLGAGAASQTSLWMAGATLALAVVAGDFVGYWRHRLEHSRALWPVHEFHHSDEAMHWSTIFRFHPLNRLTSIAIDLGALAAIGLPWWAIMGNAFFRHYYGILIHCDLDWGYGRLGRIFVSPAMHRWHHANDPAAHGKNFATIFALFDWAFGTLHLPKSRAPITGVERPGAEDFWIAMAGPFLAPWRPRAKSSSSAKKAAHATGDPAASTSEPRA